MRDDEGRAGVLRFLSGPKTGDKPDPQPEAWGVGRGVYGTGEVHPSGGRRQPPVFL